MDYGAKGDGVTNDTEAVRAAINDTSPDGSYVNGTVYFPPGVYRVWEIDIDICTNPGFRLLGAGLSFKTHEARR